MGTHYSFALTSVATTVNKQCIAYNNKEMLKTVKAEGQAQKEKKFNFAKCSQHVKIIKKT